MLKRNNTKTAFAEIIPSLFILSSPLQVICAVEAIHKFKINDYRVILFLADDVRNAQVLELCNQCDINYEIWKCQYNKFTPFQRRENKYKRVFIGDPRSIDQLHIAYSLCSDGAAFVMLDDGDDNIFMLKGYSFWNDKPLKKKLYVYLYYKVIPFIRGISFGRDLFTIYSNIPNKRFKCIENSFEYFSKSLSHQNPPEGVYFIGTNHNRYCEPGNYPLERVKKELERCLINLKVEYPQDNIYYIPHGRDTEKFPEKLCKEYGICFYKPSKTVELMFIDQVVMADKELILLIQQ